MSVWMALKTLNSGAKSSLRACDGCTAGLGRDINTGHTVEPYYLAEIVGVVRRGAVWTVSEMAYFLCRAWTVYEMACFLWQRRHRQCFRRRLLCGEGDMASSSTLAPWCRLVTSLGPCSMSSSSLSLSLSRYGAASDSVQRQSGGLSCCR